jgi:aminopeptidase
MKNWKNGLQIASKLRGRKLIRVKDMNGTDLEFNIRDRRVGVEVGMLGSCSEGKGCEVEVPSSEVYVTLLENSANGVLMVGELKEYGVRGLELRFEKGKVVSLQTKDGCNVFKSRLERAEGSKDRIAEFGLGTNYGMKPIGWTLYDEKALGTVHIAIGNNTHLGGANKASIHGRSRSVLSNYHNW